MPGQHQPPWPRAQGRDQIGLARLLRQFHDLHLETSPLQPFPQAVDQVPIAHVQFRLDAAHGGQGDQVIEQGAEWGDWVFHD